LDIESSGLNTDRFHDSISFRRILKKKEDLINKKRQGQNPAFFYILIYRQAIRLSLL
jgi:hypothetical protein